MSLDDDLDELFKWAKTTDSDNIQKKDDKDDKNDKKNKNDNKNIKNILIKYSIDILLL